MEFFLGIVTALYGVAFIVFLFLGLLGIGLNEFDDMPRPLNYLRAVLSAVLWPLTLAYSIFVRGPRDRIANSREDFFNSSYLNSSYWREKGTGFDSEEVAAIFKRHPLLSYLSLDFLENGKRRAVVGLMHRSGPLDIQDLPSWSPVRKTVETYLSRAEVPQEEDWTEGTYDDANYPGNGE